MAPSSPPSRSCLPHFYTIPIFLLFNVKDFSFTCLLSFFDVKINECTYYFYSLCMRKCLCYFVNNKIKESDWFAYVYIHTFMGTCANVN